MMNDVQLKLNEKGQGTFYIMDAGEQLGEMAISISENILTVYHTEVLEKAEGKGLAKQLLAAMTDYARMNDLKIIPLCPYVYLQFRRHPHEYEDIWVKSQADQKEQ
jgi:predicted GNAT family acetyltransferase